MEVLVDFLLRFYGWTHYGILFGILLACGFGLPMPEDITLFAGGLLAYYGITDLWATIAVCFAGVMVGDSAVFLLGSKYGRRLMRKWIFHKLLPDDRLELVKKRLQQKGNRLIFAARFMPGLRTPVFFMAGSLHLPFRVFFVYDGLAALISVPGIIAAVYIYGDVLDKVVRVVKRIEHGILFLILATVVFMVGKWWNGHRKLAIERRRRK